jgi:hypothetical protein
MGDVSHTITRGKSSTIGVSEISAHVESFLAQCTMCTERAARRGASVACTGSQIEQHLACLRPSDHAHNATFLPTPPRHHVFASPSLTRSLSHSLLLLASVFSLSSYMTGLRRLELSIVHPQECHFLPSTSHSMQWGKHTT